MDFNLTGEQRAIQSAVKELLGKEAKDLAREAEETEEGYSLELWRKLAQLGWAGISFPEEHGGSGGDFLDLILVLEEMGKALVPGPFIPSLVCSGHALLKWGDEAQKKKFFPMLASGKLIIAPALIEPSFLKEKRMVEEQVKMEKGCYFLSGTRLFVHYAHLADWIIYGTKIDEGKTLFLVDAKSPGIDYKLLKTIVSDKQFEVVFDKVRVPKENILGKIGSGEEIINEINEWGSLSQCGFILGLLEQVLKISVEYVKKREQFGKKIGSFQAIQHQCADMATDIDAVKFLTYQAAWKLSKRLPATREISMAKARASDACRRVSLLGTKVHGGIGIIIDYDMQLFFRKAKVAELAFGDANVHREIIARQMGL